LVLGETDPRVLPIFHRAGAREVWERERDFECELNELAVGGRLLQLRTPSTSYEEVFLSLHGAHQGDNAACALAAAEAFFAAPLADDVVRDAFGSASMPGRFEVVGREPLIVLDCAHNPQGAAVAAATLHDDFEIAGDTIIVIGVLSPREPRAVLDALDAADASLVIASAAPTPRAIPPDEIADAARELGATAIVEPDLRAAIDRARRVAGRDDAILVTGSLWFVGPARTHLTSGR
jgi:dihydrofolate synthase/folylpolyglutamate synthase